MDAEYHVEADGGHFALIMESRSGMPGTRAPTAGAAAGASHRSQYPQTSPDPSPDSQMVGAGGSCLRVLPQTNPDHLTVPGGSRGRRFKIRPSRRSAHS